MNPRHRRVKKLISRWQKNWGIDSWKISLRWKSGQNEDPLSNAYMFIPSWPIPRANLGLDPQTPQEAEEYLIAHELGHICTYPLWYYLSTVVPPELNEEKSFYEGYNAVENQLIDTILWISWRIRSTYEEEDE